MKSSKKLMTRVLTAALALSMVAGTSVCAFAVEDTEFDGEPLVIAAPDDGEGRSARARDEEGACARVALRRDEPRSHGAAA